MGSYGSFKMIMERKSLFERINKLIHLDDLETRLQRIEDALDSDYFGRRFKEFVWEAEFRDWSAEKKYQNHSEFFSAIEAGEYIYSHTYTLQIGKSDDTLPYHEQLFFELDFRSDFMKDIWFTKDQILVELRPPTGLRQHTQDQNTIRPILGVVIEVLQPYFGFSFYQGNPFLDKLLFGPKTYNPPWQYYWDTLVYGPELANELGLERLQAIPAFRNIELEGPMIWLSSPKGMNDELFYSHQGMSYDDGALKKLFLRACKEHEEAVKSSLNLKSAV